MPPFNTPSREGLLLRSRKEGRGEYTTSKKKKENKEKGRNLLDHWYLFSPGRGGVCRTMRVLAAGYEERTGTLFSPRAQRQLGGGGGGAGAAAAAAAAAAMSMFGNSQSSSALD